PDLDQVIPADGGQVLAIGVERDAGRKAVVRGESLDYATRLAVPDLDRPIRTRGGDPFTAGAERQAVDLGLVPKDDRPHPAEPHEIAPLPLAQVFRALVEELQGAAQAVRGQLAV